MKIASSVSESSSIQYLSRVCTGHTVSSKIVAVTPLKLQSCISRRGVSIAITSTIFSAMLASTSNESAFGLDFRMTTPDQTVAEAESMIRYHTQALLDVKSLIESENWREAQRELRKNSSLLKQDIYTIIQSKEGSIRPLLRKLYSDLFNNVSKLDYAARDKDVSRVWELYKDVTMVLSNILDRI